MRSLSGHCARNARKITSLWDNNLLSTIQTQLKVSLTNMYLTILQRLMLQNWIFLRLSNYSYGKVSFLTEALLHSILHPSVFITRYKIGHAATLRQASMRP